MENIVGNDLIINVKKGYKIKVNQINGETQQEGNISSSSPQDIRNVGSNLNLFDRNTMPLKQGLWVDNRRK